MGLSFDDVLASEGKLKILSFLVEVNGARVSDLEHILGIHHLKLKQHLTDLEALELVECVELDRYRACKINLGHPKNRLIAILVSDYRVPLTEILGREARVRILRHLLSKRYASIGELERISRAHRSDVKTYMDKLERLGIARKISVGRVTVHEINMGSMIVGILKALLEDP